MTRPVRAPDERDAAVSTRVAATIARSGPGTLVLQGGTTPGAIFARLTAMLWPWNTGTLLPGDDRALGEAHPASNLGQSQAAFGATAAAIVPLVAGMLLPHVDLDWPGAGEGGYVASLFTGSDPDPHAPQAVNAVTPEPLPPAAPFARSTWTIAALAQADAMIVVARGVAKRRALDTAVAGADLPVARLSRFRAGQ